VTPGAAAVEVKFFAVAQGSDDKTLYDTNMTLPGMFPDKQSFDIHGFSWSTTPGESNANILALSKGVWRLIASEKPWQERPLFTTPGGSGLLVNQLAVAADSVTIGHPDARNILVVEPAIRLDAGEPFRVEIKWPVAPGAVPFWFLMDGILVRAAS
jgi:hypothetical protein